MYNYNVFNVHGGHGLDGSKSCGAIGLIKESTEDRKVVKELNALLRANKKVVYDCSVDYPNSKKDCLNKIVALCNKYNADLNVSIHFNSGAKDEKGNGKSTGVEVFIYNDKTREVATNICNNIARLGFKNRGVKVNKDLAVLCRTKAPAILIECCFVDDKDDINLYSYKTMAKAIAEGLLNKKLGNSLESQIEKPNTSTGGNTSMKTIVVYSGDADVFGAILVAQKHKCPLMKKVDFELSNIKADKVLVVGGQSEDTDRFVSLKNACKYL